MKTNVKNFSKNQGITLIEITLVIALILGLTAIGVVGLSAYKKGSNAATCLAQQNKILKTTIGSLMHEINELDNIGTQNQRWKIINEFYASISKVEEIKNKIKCPSFKGITRTEAINYIFDGDSESRIEQNYGMTVDELLTSWYGSPQEAFDQIENNMSTYNLGYYIDYNYNANLDYSYLNKVYGTIYKKLSKTTFVYIACPKNWSSYGVTQNAKNKIEYHTNW